jgi:hypothetical protein
VTECPGTWLTLFLEGGGPGDGVGVFVEAAEEGLVVEDVPEAVLDFFECDVFVIERLAQEVLAGVEGKVPALLTRRTSK